MSPRLRWTVLFAAILAVAGLAVWGLLRLAPQPVLLRTDDPQLLARGQSIYMAQCASCHGEDRQGQPNWRMRRPDGRLPAPPHDETGHTWHHPDELLVQITRDGVAKAAGLEDYVSDMPAYGGTLADGDIVAVLSWIKSRWPAQARASQEKINRQSQQSRGGT